MLPMKVGDLPLQCVALNMTNVNEQMMAIHAARTRKKKDVYMAAMLDPHAIAELSMDEIRSMCDDLFEACWRQVETTPLLVDLRGR